MAGPVFIAEPHDIIERVTKGRHLTGHPHLASAWAGVQSEAPDGAVQTPLPPSLTSACYHMLLLLRFL